MVRFPLLVGLVVMFEKPSDIVLLRGPLGIVVRMVETRLNELSAVLHLITPCLTGLD